MLRECRIVALSIAIVAAALAPGRAARADGFWTFGSSATTPGAVSADGSVVAGYNTGGQFFTWTQAGGLTFIGGNAPTNGIGGSAGISGDGTIVSGNYTNPATGHSEAAYYSVATGRWTPVGSLGAVSGNEASSGWGLSGDGRALVGLGWINSGRAHAIEWTPGTGMIDLGSTVANRSSRANVASYDGKVVGGWQDASTGLRQGAVWINGTQQILTAAGTTNPVGEADAISANGRVLGGLGNAYNDNEAYLWTASTGAVGLGHLGDSSWRGDVLGLSADGSVAVGYDRPFGPALGGLGFISLNGAPMMDLTAYATRAGINLNGFTLALPTGISADGRTIVGIGYNASNTVQGFELQLPLAAVPEPSSWVLLASGLAAAVVAARRGRRARSARAGS
jgi:uncharacterized membrane protein